VRKDYKVPFRSRETIHGRTEDVRRSLTWEPRRGFRLTEYFRTMVKEGIVKVVFDVSADSKTPAYITFQPKILHVDKEVWDEADEGVPSANYILAHELGHLVLHEFHELQFSGERSKVWRDEDSSEWQANCFADELLVSESDLSNLITPSAIAIGCCVDRDVALRRLGKRLRYAGESCPECGNFTMVRSGTCLKCDTCGGTTGRS
jgi:IrrE N-terminal-like domain